jgi:hypothetical protein
MYYRKQKRQTSSMTEIGTVNNKRDVGDDKDGS